MEVKASSEVRWALHGHTVPNCIHRPFFDAFALQFTVRDTHIAMPQPLTNSCFLAFGYVYLTMQKGLGNL